MGHKEKYEDQPNKATRKKYRRFLQPQAGKGFYRGHRRHKPKNENMKNWTSSEIKLHIGNSKERVETTKCHKQTMTKDFRAHACSWDSEP